MALLLVCVMQWFSNADAVLGSDKVMGVLGRALPTVGLMLSMTMRLIPRFVRRGRTINAALGACTAAHATGTEAHTPQRLATETAKPQTADTNAATAACTQPSPKTPKRTRRARFSDQLRTVTTLMGWSMEDSLEAADSMRCRGWGATRKRTTFQRQRLRTRDGVLLAVLALLTAAAGIAAWQLMQGFGFFPALHGTLASPLAAAIVPLLCFPLFLELLGKVRR